MSNTYFYTEFKLNIEQISSLKVTTIYVINNTIYSHTLKVTDTKMLNCSLLTILTLASIQHCLRFNFIYLFTLIYFCHLIVYEDHQCLGKCLTCSKSSCIIIMSMMFIKYDDYILSINNMFFQTEKFQ